MSLVSSLLRSDWSVYRYHLPLVSSFLLLLHSISKLTSCLRVSTGICRSR